MDDHSHDWAPRLRASEWIIERERRGGYGREGWNELRAGSGSDGEAQKAWNVDDRRHDESDDNGPARSTQIDVGASMQRTD